MLRKKQIFIAVSALLNFNPAYAGALIGVNDLPGTLPTNIGAAAMALSDDGLVMVGTVRLDAFNYKAGKTSFLQKVGCAILLVLLIIKSVCH